MHSVSKATAQTGFALPPDDLSRALAIAQADDPNLRHLGVVGDTYTTLVRGKDTAGRFCVIDMYVPPGGGPPPHRHDFEETFVILEGEIEATFRGAKTVVKAGAAIHVPANAPHQFHNASREPARMLCIASPAGLDEMFAEVGVPVASRTAAPPPMDEAAGAAMRAKLAALLPKYKTELLPHA